MLTLRGNHFDLYLRSSREGGFPNACVTHWYTSPEVGLSNLHSQHWRRKSVRLYVTKFKKRCIFNCDQICWSQTEFFVCFCWTYWYGKILFVSLPSDLLFCHKTWWAIQKKSAACLPHSTDFSWEQFGTTGKKLMIFTEMVTFYCTDWQFREIDNCNSVNQCIWCWSVISDGDDMGSMLAHMSLLPHWFFIEAFNVFARTIVILVISKLMSP